MEKSDDSLAKKGELTPEKELEYFKGVIRSLMNEASKVLARIELLSHGAEIEIEEEIHLLDRYLDYTRRLCEGYIKETSDFTSARLRARSRCHRNGWQPYEIRRSEILCSNH